MIAGKANMKMQKLYLMNISSSLRIMLYVITSMEKTD